MPRFARSTTVFALTLLVSAVIAAPVAAFASTAPAAPQATRSGDQIFIPGVTTSFAHKSVSTKRGTGIKHTNDIGGAGVQEVYVSVASATSTSSDDVNGGMSESGIQTLIGQLNSYWSAQSGGAVQLELGGYETRAVSESSCSPDSVLASEEDKAFGGQFRDDAWIGTNQHLLVLTRESCGSESFATVGGDGGEIFSGNGVSTSLGMPYLLHEFGHNLGFEHADASICENTGSLDSSIANFGFTSKTCPTTEYDDYLDIMGYTVKNATPNLSSPQRILAGWLTDYAAVTDATPKQTVTLSPLGGSSGTRAIEVTDPISGEVYYLEYRTPQGRDKTSAEFRYDDQCGSSHGGYKICNLGGSTTNGVVRVLRSLPFDEEGATGTTVMALGSVSGSSVNRNTRLKTGQTFVNYDRGFSITLGSLSESAGASVTVSFELPAATSTSIDIAPGRQTYSTDNPATAEVTVTSAKQGANPTGTVAFYDGSKKLGTTNVTPAGTASYPLPSTLAVGKHAITARFAPTDSHLTASTSHSTTVTVSKMGSHTSLSPASSSVAKKHCESVIVTVATDGGVVPTGTVTVYVNGKAKAKRTLSASKNGTLTVSLPAFATTGTKKITVTYHGSSHIASSKSATSSVKVVR